jgi:hypothetical protein
VENALAIIKTLEQELAVYTIERTRHLMTRHPPRAALKPRDLEAPISTSREVLEHVVSETLNPELWRDIREQSYLNALEQRVQALESVLIQEGFH